MKKLVLTLLLVLTVASGCTAGPAATNLTANAGATADTTAGATAAVPGRADTTTAAAVPGTTAVVAGTAAPATAAGGTETDASRFKREYEILNGQTTPDGEHVYRSVDIPEDNPFVYVDGERAKELLTSGGGVLYMGYPECPWCRSLFPSLLAAYGESGYGGGIYYYNALYDRDEKSLTDSGGVTVENEGTQSYRELVGILHDYLSPYAGLNDDSIRRIYFPTTVFFKDGAVTSVHIDTVESQEDAYAELSEAQFDELTAALADKFSAIK